MKSRIDLAKYFNELGYTTGAEVGVCDGRFSKIICDSIPNLKILYCVDPYTTYEHSWRSKEHQEKTYREAQEKLVDTPAVFIRKTSLKGSEDVLDNYLDFVFIDGGHTFNDVMLDILLWTSKVKKGGIVSGHDYMYFTNSGVVEAVNKYCEMNRIELNVISRNQKNFKDDRQPCWWFRK